MTPSQLKKHVEATGSNYFEWSNMRAHGDTMANYGVYSMRLHKTPVWVLYRKRPVKHNLQSIHYFRKDNYERITEKARELGWF